MQSLILASQSPRRKELLSLFGIPYEVDPSLADEAGVTGDGCERVRKLSLLKAREVAARRKDCYVLASDTLVCFGNEILGKPVSRNDVVRMLSLLSGNTHQVWTGVCLITPGGDIYQDEACTNVTFTDIPQAWTENYSYTAEPMDKAGAYAIQGSCGIWVSSISGSASNVVGLPLHIVAALLTRAGITF